MLTLAMLALTPVQVKPLPLDTLPLADARKLDGRRVVAMFTAATVPVTLPTGDTSVGLGEADDGTERGVILRGHRLDMDPGDRLIVGGTLHVIDHPADFVNGIMVPAWVEVRVEQE